MLVLLVPLPSHSQGAPDVAKLKSAQKEAMTKLAAMDGEWRGTAWTRLPNGEKREVTQTERIGLMLDGAVRVIEGRGYLPDGSTGFNAFGIISFNNATGTYSMRSYAEGRMGDFPFAPTATGYTWETPAGGSAVMRYTATIKDGTLNEVGDYVLPDKPPVRVFEMTLKRLGDSAWPAAGAVPYK
jgi:hypothetical protein